MLKFLTITCVLLLVIDFNNFAEAFGKGRTLELSSVKSIGHCKVRTTEGSCCFFPFTYKGQNYYECTTVDNGCNPWCATTSNYPLHRLWGNCKRSCDMKTVQGTCCVFPFTYKGQQYHHCTTVANGHVPWCATTCNYDKDKKWGNCNQTPQ